MRWTSLFIVAAATACGSSSQEEPTNGAAETAGTNNVGGAGGGGAGAKAGTGGSSGKGGASATGGGGIATGGSQGSGGGKPAGGTGGSAKDGGIGTGGTNTGPDAEVLSCDAVQPGSGWQKITPPGDLGDVFLIVLDPLHVGTIYVQMHKGGCGKHYPTDGLYKSTDCGSSWNRLPAGRNATDTPDSNGKVVNIYAGLLVSLIADAVEPGVMYTVSNYGPTGVYKSTNGGVDWDQIIPASVVEPGMQWGGWFNSLSVDPTDPKHLVGGTHTGCIGAYAPNCLAETRDGGATWRLIHAPGSDNEQCGPYIHNATTMVYATGQNGAWVTTNDTTDNDNPTWTKVSQGANGADEGLLAYRASNGKYYLGSDWGVLEGSSDFLSWQLQAPSLGPLLFIVGTGQNLFASVRPSDFYTAKETNPTVWSKLQAPGTPPDYSGRWLAYDQKHKLLYSAMWGDGGGGMSSPGTGGLFRLPTP